MRLVRAHELIGRPVVSINRGEKLAQIRDIVYDATTHSLVGFTLSGTDPLHRRQSEVLPAGNVHAIGPDAVMIDDSSAIARSQAVGNASTANGEADTDANRDRGTDPVDPRAEELLADRASAAPVVGDRVLTADGVEHGEIAAVIVDIDGPPRVVGYELKIADRAENCFVPISAQKAVSGDHLVLREGATALMGDDLGSLATDEEPPAVDQRPA